MSESLLARLASRGIRAPTIVKVATVSSSDEVASKASAQVADTVASCSPSVEEPVGPPLAPTKKETSHARATRSPGARPRSAAGSPVTGVRRQELCPTPLRRLGSQAVANASEDASRITRLKKWLSEARRRLSNDQYGNFQKLLRRLAEAKAAVANAELQNVKDGELSDIVRELASHLGSCGVDKEFALQFEASLPAEPWVQQLWRAQVENEMGETSVNSEDIIVTLPDASDSATTVEEEDHPAPLEEEAADMRSLLVEEETADMPPQACQDTASVVAAESVSDAAPRPATTVYQFINGKLVAVATHFDDDPANLKPIADASSGSRASADGADGSTASSSHSSSSSSSGEGVAKSVMDSTAEDKEVKRQRDLDKEETEASSSEPSTGSQQLKYRRVCKKQRVEPESCGVEASKPDDNQNTQPEASSSEPSAGSQPLQYRRAIKKPKVEPESCGVDASKTDDKQNTQSEADVATLPVDRSNEQEQPEDDAAKQHVDEAPSEAATQETEVRASNAEQVAKEQEAHDEVPPPPPPPPFDDGAAKRDSPSTPAKPRRIVKGKFRCKGQGTPGTTSRRSSCSSPGFERVNASPECCAICCEDIGPREAYKLSCKHGWYCKDCVLRHAEARLEIGAVQIPCPECGVVLAERELRRVLPGEFIDRLQARSLEQAVSGTSDLRACPTPNCPMRVCLEEGEQPRLKCPLCRKVSCLKCGAQPYHAKLTCEEHAERRRRRSTGFAKSQEAEESFRKWMEETGTKQCPKCQCPVTKQNLEKQGTQYAECHKMMCRLCSTRFCFKCCAILTDDYTCGCSIDLHGFVNAFTGKRVNHLTPGAKKAGAKAKARVARGANKKVGGR